jgi:hypothetical protein
VQTVRKTLFTGDALQIGAFCARPPLDACGDIEWQSANAVVLPSAACSRNTMCPAGM